MTEKLERNFKGIWIPKNVWLSKALTLQEKVLLVEIDSLDQGEKGCYANNRYFADFFQLSQSRVSELIGSLEEKGFLKITRFSNGSQKEGRSIRVFRSKGLHRDPSEYQNNPSVSQTDPSTYRTDPSGNAKDNNTYNNPITNTNNIIAKLENDHENHFDIFWTAGMRKLNRKGALKIFMSIIKRDKLDSEEFANRLADDVRKRIAAKQYGFDTLHPTTYLTNERWTDEVVQNRGIAVRGNSSPSQSEAERQAINEDAYNRLFGDGFKGETIDV